LLLHDELWIWMYPMTSAKEPTHADTHSVCAANVGCIWAACAMRRVVCTCSVRQAKLLRFA